MSDPRRELPAVNTLLAEAERAGLLERAPRKLVLDSIRAVLEEARSGRAGTLKSGWMEKVTRRVERKTRPTLVPVINATGVVLHTNMGRAPLASGTRRAAEAALNYSTLELDIETGQRGSRQHRVRSLLREITGAEDGLAVTNAAAAVLLLLNTLAEGGETIVSRGELVEIGGSFRIPEILAKSGTRLVEVGTTNRTRLKDYRLAIGPRTRLLLKVHQSNFRQIGFSEETSVEDLVDLGRPRRVPVVHDVGSGLLVDLSPWGLAGEPLVGDSVAKGATVVFSGDKLLGGPQAGVVVGPRHIIEAALANPLARAVRPDKFILAALEATLVLYRDPTCAVTEIPVLSMLVADPVNLERRARELASGIPGSTIRAGSSAVGGGAFPGTKLPTTLVSLEVDAPSSLLAALRQHEPPVIARAAEGSVLFDVRTIRDSEFATVIAAVQAAREA